MLGKCVAIKVHLSLYELMHMCHVCVHTRAHTNAHTHKHTDKTEKVRLPLN